MENSKEKKPVEKPNRDSKYDLEYNPQDRLTLPKELRDYFTAQSLDFRFLNSSEFRASGNYHRSQWQPFNAKDAGGLVMQGLTGEGLIQRGDLILGVRAKALTAKYRELNKEKIRRQSNFNKSEAKRMRDHIKERGLGEHVTVDDRDDED